MTDAEREAKRALRVLTREVAHRAAEMARDLDEDPAKATRAFHDALGAIKTVEAFVGLRGNGLRDGDA